MNLKLKVSKGVLSKDGTPWAPSTIHAVNEEGWNVPYPYTMASLCLLLADPKVKSISVIDESNQQLDLTT